MSLRIRRGTNAERLTITPLSGELIYTTDSKEVFVGDGTTLGGRPVTAFTNEQAETVLRNTLGQDDLLINNTHTGITFSYNSGLGVITANVTAVGGGDLVDDTSPQLGGNLDLNSKEIFGTGSINITGSITATSFSGPVSISGSGLSGTGNIDVNGNLGVNGLSRNLNLNSFNILGTGGISVTGTVSATSFSGPVTISGSGLGGTGNIDINGTLGVNGLSRNLNLNSQNIFGTGNISITGSVGATSFSGPLTISGSGITGVGNINVVGTVRGTGFIGPLSGDVKGSVFGDDSTMLVDGVNSSITGSVNNDLTTSKDIVVGRISVEGLDGFGNLGGIKISTTGDGSDTYDLFTITGSKSSSDSLVVVFDKSRGTPDNKQPSQDGDGILSMVWFGADANADPALAAGLLVRVDGTPTAGAVPGSFVIATANSSGTLIEALTIDSDQVLQVVANTVVPGPGSGQVNIGGGVAAYLKIKIGNTFYAIPAYGLNP